jgi:hypothetical protein
MSTAVKRRIAWAIIIGLGLILLAVGILMFAEATAIPDEAKRCAPSIWQSQWPRYLGCAMAAHEGLAGGLIGAAGALFAAWLAFDAIQQQILGEAERGKIEQAEAKLAAVVCITPTVHAAAGALFSINQAIASKGNDAQQVDALVMLAASHLAVEIDRFVVQESLRGLGLDDRLVYLTIIGTLNVFVNISERPSPMLGRLQRFEAQRDALMKLHTYLTAFDPDLAQVFARDSETSLPESSPAA